MKRKGVILAKTICMLMLFMAIGIITKAEQVSISLQQIQELALKKFEMTSGGQVYDVYLYSEDANSYIASIGTATVWGGFNEGDTIVKGNFKVAYTPQGSQSYKVYNLKEISMEAFELDLTGEYIRTISNKGQGISDFLTIFLPQSSSNGELYIYEIVDGEMRIVPVIFGETTYSCVDTMFIANKAEFSGVGNLKYKGVSYCNADIGGYYMNIYKYNSTKRVLETTGQTTRWLNNHYKEYPFNKPYAITQKEIKDIIVEGHITLQEALAYTGNEKVVNGMFQSMFTNKTQLAFALEAYWSPEYVQQLFKKYSHMFKETKEGLCIGLGDIGLYYDLDQASIIKVEDYGNKKKVYMKAKLEGEKTTRTITYILKFTNHGWVLQDGGSNPMI